MALFAASYMHCSTSTMSSQVIRRSSRPVSRRATRYWLADPGAGSGAPWLSCGVSWSRPADRGVTASCRTGPSRSGLLVDIDQRHSPSYRADCTGVAKRYPSRRSLWQAVRARRRSSHRQVCISDLRAMPSKQLSKSDDCSTPADDRHRIDIHGRIPALDIVHSNTQNTATKGDRDCHGQSSSTIRDASFKTFRLGGRVHLMLVLSTPTRIAGESPVTRLRVSSWQQHSCRLTSAGQSRHCMRLREPLTTSWTSRNDPATALDDWLSRICMAATTTTRSGATGLARYQHTLCAASGSGG